MIPTVRLREIDTPDALSAWVHHPEPAVFQGMDLRGIPLDPIMVAGCSFLGCEMDPEQHRVALAAGCLYLPHVSGTPFQPFRPSLYSPEELYEGYDEDDPNGYVNCLDAQVYVSFMDPVTKQPRPVSADLMILRRLHDASISEALDDLLDGPAASGFPRVVDTRRWSTVAVMGGHHVGRDQDAYGAIARITRALTRQGFFIATGGGPGLMEAANLGAWSAGFEDGCLDQALRTLARAPFYDHPAWLSVGWRARKEFGTPIDPMACRNLGIPTWFYGHEPPNVFATHIAKFFENSIREDSLLAIALAGVIYGPGSAGTIQEVFQDACQNYYRTCAGVRSPMVLFGRSFWDPTNPGQGSGLPVAPLLYALAEKQGFANDVILADTEDEVVNAIISHPPRS